jgi:plastocyanin
VTGHLYRLAFVCGSIVAIAASAACGGSGGGGSASPTKSDVTAAVATPSIVAASTVAARAASPAAATATQPAPAPTVTAVPQGSGGPPPLPTAARATPTSPAPAPPSPSEESLTIVAKNVAFTTNSLTAHAGSVLHLTLDNQDAGVPHDIIVYDASGAVVGGTSPETGPVQQTLTVTLGAPQRYTFKCSVHPLTMNGVIIVQ